MKTDKGTTYVPLPWQIDPWNDISGTLLLTGAAGGGKTRIAAEKFHAYLLHYPKSTGIVGRKDKTAAHKSVVPFLLYTVIGDTDWGTYHKSEGMFEYKNGSQAWVVGLRDEGQRENLRSIGKDGSVDIAWFEEANKLTEADDNEITARMRGTRGAYRQKIYSTNPDAPDHWIKKKLIDGKRASVYYSRPEENPYNPLDYIEGLKQLSGVFYDRLWLGKWVQAEGAVYSEYNSAIHCLDKTILCPISGRYIITVDFGFTNPFSCSLWRIHDNRMYQVDQIYATNTIVEDHAKNIKQMLFDHGLAVQYIEAWICDHDAEDRATLERHLNITTKGAYKAITPGINAVKVRLKNNTLFLKHNARYVYDALLEKNYKPQCTADEIPAYIWSDKKQDMPIDENNHGLDEMRYGVAYIDRIDKTIIKLNSETRIASYINPRKAQEQRSFE